MFTWMHKLERIRPRRRPDSGPAILKRQSWRCLIEVLEDRTLLFASVVTDQPFYALGSTATINASGFQVGEVVHFQVVPTQDSPPGIPATVDWNVRDGDNSFSTPYQDSQGQWWYPDLDGAADGNIQTTWYADPMFVGANMQVTATGQMSGATATSAPFDLPDEGAPQDLSAISDPNAPVNGGSGSNTDLSGANVVVGGLTGNEPAVAVNPTNSNNVIVAQFNNGTQTMRISTNGGTSFTITRNAVLPGGQTFFNGDDSLAFDAQGRLFWSYLTGGTGATAGANVVELQVNPGQETGSGAFPATLL